MVTREQKINLPKDVMFVLELLQKHGQAYLVGGCIRDYLLKENPKDYDFCTDIEYDKLLDILKEYNPKEIGEHFGIIQIKLNGEHYEIAKFRKDVGKPKDRRKQEVEFTSSLSEDLKRRDFTVNSIAYDGKYLHANHESNFDDINDRTLRFNGLTSLRLTEDPLRVWRYVRFITQKKLNKCYDIDNNIISWVHNNKNRLKSLSKERIRDEFSKIITSNNPKIGLELLFRLGLLEYIIPNTKDLVFNQKNQHHNKNVLDHLISCVENSEPDLILRISALLHDVAKSECFSVDDNGVGHFYCHEKLSKDMAKDILSNLKFDNKTINLVCNLIENHMNKTMATHKAIRKLINKVGTENIPTLFKLMEADITSSMPPYDFTGLDKMKILFHEIMKENKDNPSLKVNDLAINGEDLIKLGYKQGVELGNKLKQLHEIVLEEGSSSNNKEYLLKFVDKLD